MPDRGAQRWGVEVKNIIIKDFLTTAENGFYGLFNGLRGLWAITCILVSLNGFRGPYTVLYASIENTLSYGLLTNLRLSAGFGHDHTFYEVSLFESQAVPHRWIDYDEFFFH
jgi:hypothetical protein